MPSFYDNTAFHERMMGLFKEKHVLLEPLSRIEITREIVRISVQHVLSYRLNLSCTDAEEVILLGALFIVNMMIAVIYVKYVQVLLTHV